MLSNVDPTKKALQAICICHTRELALQTVRYVIKVAELVPEIKIALAVPPYRDEKEAKAEDDLVSHSKQTKKSAMLQIPSSHLHFCSSGRQLLKLPHPCGNSWFSEGDREAAWREASSIGLCEGPCT